MQRERGELSEEREESMCTREEMRPKFLGRGARDEELRI
jgi:hypothetical protein